MADKGLIRQVVNEGLKLEFSNSELVRKTLADARNKLNKDLNNNPDLLKGKYRDLLDSYLDEVERELKRSFPIETAYRQGIKEGKDFLGDSASIPKDSNFWGWTPSIPLNAISFFEDEFVDLIQQTTKELKEKIHSRVREGIALGSSIGDIQRNILGTGLRGIKGKDGIWRTATSRAEMQARTITNSLLNRGADLTYKRINETFPELELRRVWQTVSDHRTSYRCMSLNGQIKGMSEEFKASDGWLGMMPPSHPNCRSRVTTLSKKYSKKWDSRLDGGDKEEELSRPKEKKPRKPKKVKRGAKNNTQISNEGIRNKLKDGDSFEGGDVRFTAQSINNAFDNLAKQDPELGKRLDSLLSFQAKNKIKVINHNSLIYSDQKQKQEATKYILSNDDTKNTDFSSILRRNKSNSRYLANIEGAGGYTHPGFPYIQIMGNTKTNVSELNFDRKIIDESLNRAIKNKKYITFSSATTDETSFHDNEKYLFTYIHEMGHKVHFEHGNKVLKNKINLFEGTIDDCALVPNDVKEEIITPYGKQDNAEAFAEGFVIYTLNPELMKRVAPKYFKWVDSIAREIL